MAESLYEKIVINSRNGRIELDRTFKNLYIHNPNKVTGQIVINDDRYIDPSEVDIIENVPGGITVISWSIPNPSSPITVFLSNAFMKPHELVFKVEEAIPVDVTTPEINVNLTNGLITIIPEASSIFTIQPKAGSIFSVDITNSLLDVNITNSLIYVDQVENSVWDINVTNSSLDVNVLNSSFDVNVTNSLLTVQLNQSVLDVNIQNSLLYVDQVSNSVWDVNITNSSINVNVTNSLFNVNIRNSVLYVDQASGTVWDINVTNSALNVNVTNSPLDVNITNSVLAVDVQNSVLNVNVNNSVITVDQAVGSVWDINITNSVLAVDVQNSVLNVNISGTTSVSIDSATITVDTALSDIKVRYPAPQLEYDYSVLYDTEFANVPNVSAIYSGGSYEILNIPDWESIPISGSYIAVGFTKPLIRLPDDRHSIIASRKDNTFYYSPFKFSNDSSIPETTLLTIDYGAVYTFDFQPWLRYNFYQEAGTSTYCVNFHLRIYISQDGTNWTLLDDIYQCIRANKSHDVFVDYKPIYKNITARYIKYTAKISGPTGTKSRIKLFVHKHFLWRY